MAGSTLEELLIEQLDIAREYIEKKISTIFLDGRPVDDLHGTVVREGSVLSLSAAMPGLVGATMRRKGAYASFRGAIAYHEKEGSDVRHEGFIEVKLFNLVMAELGPLFLKRGVYVRTDDLTNLISSIMADLQRGCRLILLGDRPVPGDDVVGLLRNMGPGLIRVFVIMQKDVVS